jgi:hypothetical protein
MNARDVVNELAETKLPPRLSLKLARSARTLFSALQVLEDVRKDLVKSYAKHDDKGGLVIGDDGIEWNDDDSKSQFEAEMKEALETDSEVEFSPILLKHFPKSVVFTPVEILALVDAGLVKE